MELNPNNEGIIQEIRKRYSLKIETAVLNEVISGLKNGAYWTLKKFHIKDKLKIMIGEHTVNPTGRSGFVESDTGEKLIVLQVDELRKLEKTDLSSGIMTDYGDDIPIKPILTIKQNFESFGVEETVHLLQDKGLKSLSKLPSNEKRIPSDIRTNGVRYMLQPHEFQALILRGEYFRETYGDNPLLKLEEFIRSKQT